MPTIKLSATEQNEFRLAAMDSYREQENRLDMCSTAKIERALNRLQLKARAPGLSPAVRKGLDEAVEIVRGELMERIRWGRAWRLKGRTLVAR